MNPARTSQDGQNGTGWLRRMRIAAEVLRGHAPASATPNNPPAGDWSIDRAIEVLAATSISDVQKRGYHFQPRNYYSALNDLPFLVKNRDLWHDRPLPRGIHWDLDTQLDFVRHLSPYFAELSDVPCERPPGPPRYYWGNDFWSGSDALVHYGLLRDLKPRRVVEVGSGWSSLLMSSALKRNEADGSSPASVDQVEPFPRKELLSALPAHWALHEVPLQRANLELFDRLESGDLCFYDGSHVARAGSDVVWFFFEVLPRLKPGVWVHVHDIFWPSDYPDEWILKRGQTWNEQYLFQAFLMYNTRFEPLICNAALHECRSADMEELCQDVADSASGASVWFRRLED